ncbi:hypothetical protein AB7M74_002239 [Bradyrhizobium japonicum]
MRRQLGNQPIRQRFGRILVLLFGVSSVTCDRDDCPLNGATCLLPLDRLRIGALPDFSIDRGDLVLRSDITPVHRQTPFGIDADEDAGADDLGRIVDHRPFFERDQCRLDLTETLVDLVRQLVGILILRFEPRVLRIECVYGGLLLWGELDRLAPELAQAVGVAVREIDTENHFQLSLAIFSASSFSLSVTRRSNKAASCKYPPSSCSNRSRKTPPPACS